MEIQEVTRKNPNKTIVISIRTTEEISKWMAKNKVMPSKVFHKAIEELRGKNGKLI